MVVTDVYLFLASLFWKRNLVDVDIVGWWGQCGTAVDNTLIEGALGVLEVWRRPGKWWSLVRWRPPEIVVGWCRGESAVVAPKMNLLV